jgi:hypothetical protein
MFTIKLENGVSVMAHLSGKIRQVSARFLCWSSRAESIVLVEAGPRLMTVNNH